MSQEKTIRHAIEELYGPCPVDDFVRANDWANAIDWEEVVVEVEAEHPEFEWTHHDPKDLEVAEATVIDVRHDMLRHAGHEVPK